MIAPAVVCVTAIISGGTVTPCHEHFASRVLDRRRANSPACSGPLAGSRRSRDADDGVVRIFRERGGRNGKVVTVIRGLPAREVEPRAAELKRACGAGGAVKDGHRAAGPGAEPQHL